MKLTLDLALTVLAVLTAFLAKHSMTLPALEAVSVLFRHYGLKNSHGYIMMKVLTSQGATCLIAKVKKMHWTVAEIKKMLLYAQVIRTGKMHLKISENTRHLYIIALLFLATMLLSETSWNIFELINENSKKVMAMNRRCFIKIIECCRVLARQNIAFQGASELNSNFHQILKY